jgi:hypothetical protein
MVWPPFGALIGRFLDIRWGVQVAARWRLALT